MDYAKNMSLSDEGIIEICTHEGVVLSPYRDSVGVWTIFNGITAFAGGSINPQKFRGTITMEQGLALFREVLPRYENYVRKVVKAKITQKQYDALVSIIWNIGPKPASRTPSFIKRLNEGNIAAASSAIMMWTKPVEITSRRKKERLLFDGGPYSKPVLTVYKASANGKIDWKSGARLDASIFLKKSRGSAGVRVGKKRDPEAENTSGNTSWQKDLGEVKRLQSRLHELNYTELGKIDGKYGRWTRGAFLRFKADNGLPLNEDLDDQVRSALFSAVPDDTHLGRAGKTPEGSRISFASTASAITGGSIAVGGVSDVVNGPDSSSSAVDVGTVLDKAEQIQSTAERATGIFSFLTDNPIVHMASGLHSMIEPLFPWLALAGGIGIVYFGVRAYKARVQDYQTGKTR